jgi:hypothetical protein
MTKKKENVGFGPITEVDSSELATYRYIKKKKRFERASKFIDTIRLCGRDRTVQRESVWRFIPGKQSSYMSAVAHGYSDTTTFHLVNLKETISNLEPKALLSGNPRDLQFVDHLKSFTKNGDTHIHIDGGNRSDTLIDWYDNKVCLEPGNYLIENESGEIERITLSKSNYYCYSRLMESGGSFQRLAEWIDKQLFEYQEYYDLNREERADLFRKLNDNENLNTEEFRNCSTADICTCIRDLNDEVKQYFNFGEDAESYVTGTNMIRYKFCSWLASLNNYYTYRGSLDSWQDKNLDADYQTGSLAEQTYPEFKKFFFNVFLPLVNHITKRDPDKKKKGFKNLQGSRNRLIDLFIVLVEIYKEGGELTRDDKKKVRYEDLVQTYLTWIAPLWSDLTPKFNTSSNSRTNIVPFKDLYGANTHYKLKYRLTFLKESFIPLLSERGLVVKKDSTRYADPSWRLSLWSDQNGICPLTDEEIPLDWVEDGEKTHMDHIVPHSKGGMTVYENMQLVLADANLAKSDK